MISSLTAIWAVVELAVVHHELEVALKHAHVGVEAGVQTLLHLKGRLIRKLSKHYSLSDVKNATS